MISLDPNLNSVLISIVAGIVIYEYHIIRRYEQKMEQLEERIRWMEYLIKEKELKKQ
jgi:purine-cytosine permease-like protein